MILLSLRSSHRSTSPFARACTTRLLLSATIRKIIDAITMLTMASSRERVMIWLSGSSLSNTVYETKIAMYATTAKYVRKKKLRIVLSLM